MVPDFPMINGNQLPKYRIETVNLMDEVLKFIQQMEESTEYLKFVHLKNGHC